MIEPQAPLAGAQGAAAPPQAAPRARALAPRELDAHAIAAWHALERRCLDHNPYLSPHFVRPALEHLTPGSDVRLVAVEAAGQWVALAVFEPGPFRLRFPVGHRRAYRSPHSMLGGVLVDAAWGERALRALLDFLDAGGLGRTAVHWDFLAGDSAICGLLRRSPAWHEEYTTQRALLASRHFGEGHLPPRRRKDLHRRERRLAEIAPVHWRLLRGADIDERCIDTFLHLEHLGWRGESGTSLRSDPAHEAFFRAMVAGFASDDRMFFTELLLGDKVISSTSNLLADEAAFAFKLGWDPAYASMAPGILNEVALVRELPRALPRLSYLDSGASTGSYLEDLYPGRREVVSGWYALGAASAAYLKGVSWARRLKRRLARKAGSGPHGVQAV